MPLFIAPTGDPINETISAKKRSKLPSTDFADPKNRAYPVDTPARAKAAAGLAGMHGASSTIKNRIAKIAKKKGFAAKESAPPVLQGRRFRETKRTRRGGLRETAWTDEERTAALEPQPAARIKDTRAVSIANDWFNGQDSAMYLFAKTGGEIKSENIYRRLKSEISDALRMVISNPNYAPDDASNLHALMGHVRAIGQENEYEGVKKAQTATGYYYGGGCCASPSSVYPY